jgi:hypothetical protein
MRIGLEFREDLGVIFTEGSKNSRQKELFHLLDSSLDRFPTLKTF